jgi:hypothetical protein
MLCRKIPRRQRNEKNALDTTGTIDKREEIPSEDNNRKEKTYQPYNRWWDGKYQQMIKT